jgi:type 1 glutamine amidotransferase
MQGWQSTNRTSFNCSDFSGKGRTIMRRKQLLIVLVFWLLPAVVATAAPPYKALIVTGQNGHDWKGTTPVLWKILEDTGLFMVDVATSPPKGQDMSGFKPDFAAYSVVISNYQGDEWPEQTKSALVDYVESGGGLVIYHFALASFPKWKEYNEMIGLGGWGGRTEADGPYVRFKDGKIVRQQIPGKTGHHGPMQPFQVVVREPEHPIMKGLPPVFAHVPDELYGWLRGPAKNLTVLATAFAPKEKGGADEHEPLLFTIEYGKGRVFQNALGHTAKELKSVDFIVTFQRGVEWAASGQVTQGVPKDFPGPDEPVVRE